MRKRLAQYVVLLLVLVPAVVGLRILRDRLHDKAELKYVSNQGDRLLANIESFAKVQKRLPRDRDELFAALKPTDFNLERCNYRVDDGGNFVLTIEPFMAGGLSARVLYEVDRTTGQGWWILVWKNEDRKRIRPAASMDLSILRQPLTKPPQPPPPAK